MPQAFDNVRRAAKLKRRRFLLASSAGIAGILVVGVMKRSRVGATAENDNVDYQSLNCSKIKASWFPRTPQLGLL